MKRDPADWPFPPPVWAPDMSRRKHRIVYRLLWVALVLGVALALGGLIGALQ